MAETRRKAAFEIHERCESATKHWLWGLTFSWQPDLDEILRRPKCRGGFVNTQLELGARLCHSQLMQEPN